MTVAARMAEIGTGGKARHGFSPFKPQSGTRTKFGGTTTNGRKCHHHSYFGLDKWRCYNQPLFTISNIEDQAQGTRVL